MTARTRRRCAAFVAGVLLVLLSAVGPVQAATAAPVDPPAEGTAAPVVREPAEVPSDGPAYLRDLAPIAVLGLAVGGVAGFELSRRGL